MRCAPLVAAALALLQTSTGVHECIPYAGTTPPGNCVDATCSIGMWACPEIQIPGQVRLDTLCTTRYNSRQTFYKNHSSAARYGTPSPPPLSYSSARPAHAIRTHFPCAHTCIRGMNAGGARVPETAAFTVASYVFAEFQPHTHPSVHPPHTPPPPPPQYIYICR